jgi:hypothetical protein
MIFAYLMYIWRSDTNSINILVLLIAPMFPQVRIDSYLIWIISFSSKEMMLTWSLLTWCYKLHINL